MIWMTNLIRAILQNQRMYVVNDRNPRLHVRSSWVCISKRRIVDGTILKFLHKIRIELSSKCSCKLQPIFVPNVRGRSDKSLASPSGGGTIAWDKYFCIVHSCRRLLSKLQPNQICSLVLTACRCGRVRVFLNKGKTAISIGDSIFGLEKIAQQNRRRVWMQWTYTLLSRWWALKVAFTSLNVVSYQFLMSCTQGHWMQLPWRTTWQRFTISNWQIADWM